MPTLSDAQKAAIREEARLELARQSFWDFCVYMDSGFFTEGKWHLKEIAEAFQKVAEGLILKLIISMPPRAGKSYITSLFCAWLIGKYPADSIMRNSYAAELAEKFSYDIRSIIQMDRYRALFPGVELKKDKRAINDWTITEAKQTTYFCAGVGGPITGKGCTKAAILDDPVKNIEEALSETVLESKWNWYTSTHLSRLESGCPEIHIATRWSKKDIIGRLLDEFPEDWTVITIPALIDGKTFCAEIKTTKELLDIKKVNEDFIWEAEYMQNPIESKGLLFPVEELKRFSLSDLASKKPDGIVGYTDTADQGEDYLCSPIGKKFGDYTYITDVLFTQEGVEVTEPLVAQLIIDTNCDLMKVESNSGGKSFANNVRKLLKAEKNGCSIVFEPNMQNKETRILMNAGYIKEYFYFRNDYEPGSDYDKFMRQLVSYVKIGKNKHDDAPDGLTGLAQYVKLMKRPIKEEKVFNAQSSLTFTDPPKHSITGGEATRSYLDYGF